MEVLWDCPSGCQSGIERPPCGNLMEVLSHLQKDSMVISWGCSGTVQVVVSLIERPPCGNLMEMLSHLQKVRDVFYFLSIVMMYAVNGWCCEYKSLASYISIMNILHDYVFLSTFSMELVDRVWVRLKQACGCRCV
jgi:hypothetical protein